MLASRRAEILAAAPLAFAYGLVMAALYVLRPVKGALLLDRLGVGALPYATIAVALLGVFVGGAYSKAARGARIDRLAAVAIGAVIASLLAFRLALPSGGAPIVFAFYVWVTLAAPLVTSVVWMLASAGLDAREARRLFRILGTGGIVGAIAGGLLTRAIVHAMGALDLLLVASALLLLSLAPLRLARIEGAVDRHAQRPARPSAETSTRGPGAVRDVALIRALALTAFVGAVVSVIVDVQFNDFVGRGFVDRDAKAAFLGTFFAALSACALVCQVWVGPKLLASRGLGAALAVLPLAVGLGSTAILLAPTLAVAVGLKFGDGSLRYSVHKSTTEILVVPLAPEARARAKPWLDTTVPAAGEAVGAAIVLLVVRMLHASYATLGVVSVGLVGVWLLTSSRARLAYVEAFRCALTYRDIDVTEVQAGPLDASTRAELLRALASDGVRTVTYAIDLLAPARDDEVTEALQALLSSPQAAIRSHALAALRTQGRAIDRTTLDELLRDPHSNVRAAALAVLRDRGEGVTGELVRDVLEQAADQLAIPRYRRASREALASFGNAALALVTERLATMNRAARRELLRVVAMIPTQAAVDLLEAELAAHARRPPVIVASIVDALAKLRASAPELRFDPSPVLACLEDALGACASLDRDLAAARPLASTQAGRLLVRVLAERRAAMLERVFLLLGLLYPAKEIRAAFHALSKPASRRSANAVEFLDNVLERRHSRPLLRVVEGGRTRAPREDPAALLDRLAIDGDPWLRACAVFCAAANGVTGPVARARQDPDPTVREAAWVAPC
jgi:ATP/ADP translocase